MIHSPSRLTPKKKLTPYKALLAKGKLIKKIELDPENRQAKIILLPEYDSETHYVHINRILSEDIQARSPTLLEEFSKINRRDETAPCLNLSSKYEDFSSIYPNGEALLTKLKECAQAKPTSKRMDFLSQIAAGNVFEEITLEDNIWKIKLKEHFSDEANQSNIANRLNKTISNLQEQTSDFLIHFKKTRQSKTTLFSLEVEEEYKDLYKDGTDIINALSNWARELTSFQKLNIKLLLSKNQLIANIVIEGKNASLVFVDQKYNNPAVYNKINRVLCELYKDSKDFQSYFEPPVRSRRDPPVLILNEEGVEKYSTPEMILNNLKLWSQAKAKIPFKNLLVEGKLIKKAKIDKKTITLKIKKAYCENDYHRSINRLLLRLCEDSIKNNGQFHVIFEKPQILKDRISLKFKQDKEKTFEDENAFIVALQGWATPTAAKRVQKRLDINYQALIEKDQLFDLTQSSITGRVVTLIPYKIQGKQTIPATQTQARQRQIIGAINRYLRKLHAEECRFNLYFEGPKQSESYIKFNVKKDSIEKFSALEEVTKILKDSVLQRTAKEKKKRKLLHKCSTKKVDGTTEITMDLSKASLNGEIVRNVNLKDGVTKVKIKERKVDEDENIRPVEKNTSTKVKSKRTLQREKKRDKEKEKGKEKELEGRQNDHFEEEVITVNDEATDELEIHVHDGEVIPIEKREQRHCKSIRKLDIQGTKFEGKLIRNIKFRQELGVSLATLTLVDSPRIVQQSLSDGNNAILLDIDNSVEEIAISDTEDNFQEEEIFEAHNVEQTFSEVQDEFQTLLHARTFSEPSAESIVNTKLLEALKQIEALTAANEIANKQNEIFRNEKLSLENLLIEEKRLNIELLADNKIANDELLKADKIVETLAVKEKEVQDLIAEKAKVEQALEEEKTQLFEANVSLERQVAEMDKLIVEMQMLIAEMEMLIAENKLQVIEKEKQITEMEEIAKEQVAIAKSDKENTVKEKEKEVENLISEKAMVVQALEEERMQMQGLLREKITIESLLERTKEEKMELTEKFEVATKELVEKSHVELEIVKKQFEDLVIEKSAIEKNVEQKSKLIDDLIAQKEGLIDSVNRAEEYSADISESFRALQNSVEEGNKNVRDLLVRKIELETDLEQEKQQIGILFAAKAEREQQVAEIEMHLVEMERQLNEKGTQVEEMEKLIAEKEQKITEMEKTAKDKAAREKSEKENLAKEKALKKKIKKRTKRKAKEKAKEKLQDKTSHANSPKQKTAKGKAAKEKAAKEKAAKEKAAREKAAKEKAALEKAALEKAALEKAAKEKAALEKAALEKAALEKSALEKGALEKAALEKAAKKWAAKEKAAKEKAEMEHAAMVEMEQAAMVEMEQAAMVEMEHAAMVEMEQVTIVEREHAAMVEMEQVTIVEREQDAIENSVLESAEKEITTVVNPPNFILNDDLIQLQHFQFWKDIAKEDEIDYIPMMEELPNDPPLYFWDYQKQKNNTPTITRVEERSVANTKKGI